jgi:sec-independent protein translocase protein TatA
MFEGLFQPLHLLVIFVIAMLIFGPKKLADLGKGLGQGIREFKDAVKDGDHQSTSTPTPVEKEHDKTNVG